LDDPTLKAIVDFVQGVGFPIFVATWLLLRWEKIFRQLIEQQTKELALLNYLVDEVRYLSNGRRESNSKV